MGKQIIAIMYDFDRTLATEDMQNFGFIKDMGLTPEQFWKKTQEFCSNYDVDKILGYMYMMIKTAKEKGIALTREYLYSTGKLIKFYDGVTTWFKRINEYASNRGLIVEHYLITSGNKEIIEGTSIAKEFKQIFGCEYLYDEDTKLAYWPKTMINYTQKTQYVFRISKGAITDNDDKKVNEKTVHRRIKYENMIYLGDGLTDVPGMIVVKQNEGHSIAVYPKGMRDKVSSLFEDGRVDYIAKADYSINGELEKIVHLIIDSISIRTQLDSRQEKTKASLLSMVY
jgi:hypothetical protein